MRWRAPFMDQGLSALIEDIYDRGLDRKILVVAVGEFGRTPRLASPKGVLGRDHWPSAQSALVSGGGLRMGQVIGATTAKAEYPVERPLTPQGSAGHDLSPPGHRLPRVDQRLHRPARADPLRRRADSRIDLAVRYRADVRIDHQSHERRTEHQQRLAELFVRWPARRA